MDREYPQFDYCYCDQCVADFKNKTSIDIKSVEDPSQIGEWKQFRYDLITNLVNRLVTDIHNEHKKITAAVFPGPSVAKKIVRQEWNKWNGINGIWMLFSQCCTMIFIGKIQNGLGQCAKREQVWYQNRCIVACL